MTQTIHLEEFSSTAQSKLNKYDLILNERESARKIAKNLLKKWRCRIHEEELNSIVDLALCQAATKFDSKLNNKFITFSFFYIKGLLIKHIQVKVNDAKNTAIIEDIYQYTGESDITANRETKNSSLKYHLKDPEEIFLENEKIEVCLSALKSLNNLESTIIENHFIEKITLIELAHTLGYGRHYVLRIKKRAINKLKQCFCNYNSNGTVEKIRAKSSKSKALRNNSRIKIAKAIAQ